VLTLAGRGAYYGRGASLRFRFEDRKLRRLYEQSSGREKLPEGVATAFDEVVSMIESAADERDLYALKSLRYEKLSGPRRGQRSLRSTINGA